MIESLREYESILESDDVAIRLKAAPETASADVWLDILVRRPELAEEIAFNKHIPALVVDKLIESASACVRCAIAMKRGLELSQFERLATDDDESVRIMVTNNKKTPQSILYRLTYDTSEYVANSARMSLHHRKDSS